MNTLVSHNPDKIEPYLEPLSLPILVEGSFWLFLLVEYVASQFLGPFGNAPFVLFINFYSAFRYLSPILVLVYEALLWLKLVKPRALIKSTNPVFLKLRWIVVVVGLYLCMNALRESIDFAYWAIQNWLHPNNLYII